MLKIYLQIYSLDREEAFLAAEADGGWRAPLWFGTRLLGTFCTASTTESSVV